jgi:hypothetical protein
VSREDIRDEMGFSEGITIEKVEVSCCEEDLSKYCTRPKGDNALVPNEPRIFASHSFQAS